MKQISIELPKPAYLPGELVEGNARLTIDRPVKARAIKLNVVGLEETSITVGSGDDSRTYRERNFLLKNEIILHGPQFEKNVELPPGNYLFKFEYVIPENALPSYKGTNSSVTYKLRAKVDVPLWFDIEDKKEIFVFRNRGALKLLTHPARFWSENFSNLNPDKPGFSVELTKTGYLAGEAIEGTVNLKNMATSRIRHIYIRLLGEEFAWASGYHRNVTQQKHEIEISVANMVEGIPKLFFLPIPRDAPTSYEGLFSNFRWAVEVGLDIPFGFDVKALHPVEILR
ncbi:MAG: hypothetical protein JSV09_04440 [Thermoplasmata archaeon]|nr:MAG: hypothetical protein JSV09_04440 [Thermoplasmata archaeon]